MTPQTTSKTMLGFLLTLLLLPTVSFGFNFGCDLYCYNDGECQHGKGKFGSYTGITEEETEALPFTEQTHVNGMYCSCPVGYTGLQCEIKVQVCGVDGQDQHTCFNGSECVKERTDNGKVYYRCECDPALSILDAAYAGKFCEHISTIFCDHRAGDAGFGSSSKFCTNGGKCLSGDSGKMCLCPDGWEGQHCEFQIEGFYLDTVDLSNPTHLGIGAILVICILGCCICIACGCWYKSIQDEKLRNRNYSTTKITKTTTKKSSSSSRVIRAGGADHGGIMS